MLLKYLTIHNASFKMSQQLAPVASSFASSWRRNTSRSTSLHALTSFDTAVKSSKHGVPVRPHSAVSASWASKETSRKKKEKHPNIRLVQRLVHLYSFHPVPLKHLLGGMTQWLGKEWKNTYDKSSRDLSALANKELLLDSRETHPQRSEWDWGFLSESAEVSTCLPENNQFVGLLVTWSLREARRMSAIPRLSPSWWSWHESDVAL